MSSLLVNNQSTCHEMIPQVADSCADQRGASECSRTVRGPCRRILHVVAPNLVGGLESMVCALSDAQREFGHDPHIVAIVSLPSAGHPFLSRAMNQRTAVHVIQIPNRAYLRERSRVAGLCHALRPDVVHLHGYRPVVVDGPATRGLGVCTVVTIHGFTGKDWKNRIYEQLQCRECRHADATVAVSRTLANSLIRKGMPGNRLHTVVNAWSNDVVGLPRCEARRILGLSDTGFIMGWVGRLSHEKGADLLLDALAHVQTLPLDVSVVGDGPLRDHLMQKARTLCPCTAVHWHGVVPDAAKLFAAFDLLVLSSRTEGTPIVLLEAMAAQVPIVAFGVGGVPDMLSSSDAIVVPPDDCGALAAAIRATLQDRASAMARAAHAHRRLTEDFDRRSWVERYDRVYTAALHNCRTRNRGNDRPCKLFQSQLLQ